MSTTRIAWLIGLILAASTLPANEWPVAADDDQSAKTESSADTGSPADAPPPDKPTDGEQEKPSSGQQPALEADVWDGGAVRAQCTGTAGGVRPVVLTSLPPGDVCSPAEREGSILWARVETRMPRAPSQRTWLTCRYAHAPPIGV